MPSFDPDYDDLPFCHVVIGRSDAYSGALIAIITATDRDLSRAHTIFELVRQTQAPVPRAMDPRGMRYAYAAPRSASGTCMAAWCVTCQFNKKTTFSDAKLLEDFAQKNVLLLRADWTRYDPAITKALNQLGRNGLPVYAWYAPGQEVLILSELPSVQEVQNALSQVKSAP
jgi:thiol:disulfide interchange protein DsbD